MRLSRPASPPRAGAPRLAILLIAVLALLGAGCAGSEPETNSGDQQAAPPPSDPQEPEIVRNPSLRSLGVSDDTSQKPTFAVPQGSPPDALQVYDVKEGEGAVADPGRPLTMQYVGKAYSTGEQFDSSWDRDEPFSFTLGAGEVIPGWDMGIEGMRESGRRILVVPSDLAYGDQGSPPDIEPGETLVFVVDLEKVGR